MSRVEVRYLVKNYGNVKAVDNLSFEADSGRILAILGPSGAGKTTVLRCIAGLEIPESGAVRIGNAIVFSSANSVFVPPEKRQIGMVFQSYAIWPHMNVFDNIAFPLKIRKNSDREIKDRVRAALALVKLEGLEKRLGLQLSAGQQQRVAFARAVVYEPELLLLDEPLSNLDAKLREYMRIELKELQRRIGITTIYVTHDHAEAFALSDKVMVVHEGRNIAYGTAKDLYEKPPSLLVATFLGHSNILPARVVENCDGELAMVETPLGPLLFRISPPIKEGDSFHLCLRGRLVSLHRSKPPVDVNVVRGVLKAIVYRGGDNYDYVISVNDSAVRIHGRTVIHEKLSEGDHVYLEIPVEACTVIPN